MQIQEISSLQHPIVKHLVRLRQERSYRLKNATALVPGVKLISELHSLHPFKTLLIAKGYTPPFPLTAERIFIAPDPLLKKITALAQPEPLIAEIPLAPQADLIGLKRLLILDGLSDPGNLGTLLRTALALGWQGVFLTPNTTDPFSEKAIRAAKGATFKLPYKEGSYEELEHLLKVNQMQLLLADPKGETVDQIPVLPACALALGNESHGLSSLLKRQGKKVAIPILNVMESLNVAAAGAILMHQLQGAYHV